MKSRLLPALIAISGLVLVTLIFVSPGRGQGPKALQQWEYKVIDPDDKGGDAERRLRLQVQLDPLGKEGWELVEMPYLKGVRYQVIIFKRSAQ